MKARKILEHCRHVRHVGACKNIEQIKMLSTRARTQEEQCGHICKQAR